MATSAGLEDVDVERAAQAAIGRDHDHADALHFVAFLEERMAIVRIGLRQIADDRADLLGIGARQAHAVLGATHLAGRHHLHRLGDLLRALHARDLGADFLCSRHLASVL
jgi:hypothetical protein